MESNYPEPRYPIDNLAKSNTLIYSKYKTTVLGQKVFLLSLFHLQTEQYSMSKSGGNLVCVIPVREFRERLEWKGNSIYRDLERVADSLTNYKFLYKDPVKHEFSYVNIFTEISYKNGEMSVTFNGDMKEYLTALENNYTLLNLPLMLKWKGAYSFRIFEILSAEAYKFKDNGYRCVFEMGLAEFKFLIGCYDVDAEIVRLTLKNKKISDTDFEAAEAAIVAAIEAQKDDGKGKKKHIKQYLKWFDFKRAILDQSIEEINKTRAADLYIDKVEPLKKGRGGKVYAVRFYYHTHLKENDVVDDEQKKEINFSSLSDDEKLDLIFGINKILSEYNVRAVDIRNIGEAAHWDLDAVQTAADVLKNSENVDNPVAFLIVAIKNKWEPAPIHKTKKNRSYLDYEQREYDVDSIENILLGKKDSLE